MNVKLALAAALALSTASVCGQSTALASEKCAALSKLSIPSATVEVAQLIDAGAFRLPEDSHPGKSETEQFVHAPEFCRLVLHLTPSPDSKIGVELWIPERDWNKKFRGQGNGGFAGEIDYRGLATAITQGYATASTNTGHSGAFTDGSWALGHPEKVIDFGYRAIHEMTLVAKKIIQIYYGQPPQHSYFASCSTGGRQGLMEAQRFPEDYDGILAGAPANNWTGLMTDAVANEQALSQDPLGFFPPSKLPAISAAVLAACDATDGIKDGVLNDPAKCHFNPSSLLCNESETDQCLTKSQVNGLQKLYAGTYDSQGKLIFPGYPPGGELGNGGWAAWLMGSASGHAIMSRIGNDYFSYMVYQDPAWNFKTFSVDTGFKAAVKQTSKTIDATSPDLKAFASRGGKLILFHGWNDAAITVISTIGYYNSIRSSMGDSMTDSFARLFLAPGTQHCYGGPGPDSFGQYELIPSSGLDDPQHNLYLALVQWVEKGVAPESVVAAKFEGQGPNRIVKMARPLCAFPKIAIYKGSGDTNNVENFYCGLQK
jgi:hypothetical protein